MQAIQPLRASRLKRRAALGTMVAALAARALAAAHAQAMPEPDARAPADPRLAPVETGFARVVPPPGAAGPEPAHDSVPDTQGSEAGTATHPIARPAGDPSATSTEKRSPARSDDSAAGIRRNARQGADSPGADPAQHDAGNAR
jgi:hypothetical protein